MLPLGGLSVWPKPKRASSVEGFREFGQKMRSISRFASRGVQGARREAGDNGAQRRNPDEAERINKLQGGAVNPARVNREVRDNGMK